MARTATTEQVAAALHVGPATVRKYARNHQLPYDTTPGGHRRFDVVEAVAAMRGQQLDDRDVEPEIVDFVPYVQVEPTHEVAVLATVAALEAADVTVYDSSSQVHDWAAETSVV